MSSKDLFFVDACTKLHLFPIYDGLKRSTNELKGTKRQLAVLLYSNKAEALKGYLLPVVSTAILPDKSLEIFLCGASEGLLNREQCDALKEYNVHVHCTATPPIRTFDCVYCDPELAEQGFVADGNMTFIGQTKRLPAELERLTLNINYCYETQRSHAASLAKLREKLIADPYSMESSILAALHIRSKLFAIGISPEPFQEAARQYYEMLHDPHNNLLGHIAALEHIRWCICMILNGWRSMREADWINVFNIDSEAMIASTKDSTNGWHAALVPCGVPMQRPLSLYTPEQWDNENTAAEIDLDALDKQSLALHRHAKVQRQEHLIRARELLKELNPLVEREPLMRIDSLIDQLDKAPNTSLTANAEITFNNVRQALKNNAKALKLLQILERCTASMLEYAEFRDLKIGDFAIAELLPVVLLFDLEYNTLIKTLTPKADENALPILLLNPKQVVFLIPDNMPERIYRPLIENLRDFAATRNLRSTITAINVADHSLKSWTEAIEQASSNDPSPLYDVTGASASFARAVIGRPSIIVRNGKILRYEGATSSCEAFNALNLQMLCTDVMQLANRQHKAGWGINNWAEIQKEITGLFEAHLKTEDSAFTNFSTMLAQNAHYVSNPKEIENNNIFPTGLITLQADARSSLKTTCSELISDASHLDAVYTALADFGIIEEVQRISERGKVTYTLIPRVELSCSQKEQLTRYATDASIETPYVIERTPKNELKVRQIYNKFKLSPEKRKAHENALNAFRSYITGPDESGFYTYKNNAVRQVLSKAGNILEDYLYRQLCLSGLFTDVQLGYTFQSKDGMVENEIDCIGIVGGRDAIFFSCKSGEQWLKKGSPFVEIARHRDTLGIGHAKAVLVTSSSEKLLKAYHLDPPNGQHCKKILEQLDVHIINLPHLRSPEALRARLQEIITASTNN